MREPGPKGGLDDQVGAGQDNGRAGDDCGAPPHRGDIGAPRPWLDPR